MRDDARHDDQRNAVADTPAGDLLAKPHQEHGAADQRRHARDAEHQARVDDGRRALTRAPALQPYGDSIAMEGAEEHGAVARILIKLLAAALALLLQRAQSRDERGRKTNDDGGGDIGHHHKRAHRTGTITRLTP